MNVSGIERGTYYVIRAEEFLGIENLPALRATVNMALTVGHKFIAFDLSNCHHISSTILGLMAKLYKKLCAKDGKLAVLNPSFDLKQMILASKASYFLEILESEQQFEKAI